MFKKLTLERMSTGTFCLNLNGGAYFIKAGA